MATGIVQEQHTEIHVLSVVTVATNALAVARKHVNPMGSGLARMLSDVKVNFPTHYEYGVL